MNSKENDIQSAHVDEAVSRILVQKSDSVAMIGTLIKHLGRGISDSLVNSTKARSGILTDKIIVVTTANEARNDHFNHN